MSTYDAIVIGGGPAGCSAAITLRRQGWKVALLEAKEFPHHKVCGEFLSPECSYLLNQLGLTEAICTANPTTINTVCITAANGTRWEAGLPGKALGISRKMLDGIMASQALHLGVELYESTTATQITGNLQECFEVQARTPMGERGLSGRVVIAAHGKRSNLDRALKRHFLQKRQPYTGLKAHFNGPPLPGRIELHTFRGGYCGMSEIEDGTMNVCLLAQKSALHPAGDPVDIESFIGWMGSQNPYLGQWLRDSTRVSERWLSISEVPFVAKRPIVNEILMAGDAAGLIAPLAGDGIAVALHSGLIAGQLVTEFLCGQISSDMLLNEYASEWRKQFQSRLRLSWMLQPLMFTPSLSSTALNIIRTIPSLGDYLIHKTRDVRLIQE